jgi:hypothetical protein
MDFNHAVLVAMMFIMILSIGIGSLLMAMAGLINRGSACKTYSIHTSWMILMLLLYFNLFWQTLALLSIEDWMFRDFLYAIAGPVTLLFASSLLIPEFSGEESLDLRKHYFTINRQFFFLLALTQLWAVGIDFVLRRGFTPGGAINILTASLFLALALSRDPRLHGLISGLVWVIFFATVGLRTLGLLV